MSAARHSQPPTALRPKALPLMARKPALEARERERLRRQREMAMVLGWVMRDFRHADGRIGVSNVEMGRLCGVSESVVRGWLNRKSPFPTDHLMQLPPDLGDALIAAWRALFGPECKVANDLDDDGPTTAA